MKHKSKDRFVKNIYLGQSIKHQAPDPSEHGVLCSHIGVHHEASPRYSLSLHVLNIFHVAGMRMRKLEGHVPVSHILH